MTPDEISAAVEKVRQWAEDTRHLWDRNDDFTLRLHVWSNAKLSDAQIEDLINKAHGDRHADTVLSLLLASRFLKKDASPLEIWAYSIFEERAMRRRPGQKATHSGYVWRDAFISEAADCLLAEHPGLDEYRNEAQRDKPPPTAACAIVKFGLALSGVNLSESEVNKIYEKQHPR